jgi:hypothetical protein
MGNSGYPVFSGCTQLSTLTIGDNVTRIPSAAFSGCTGLTSVDIPNSVTTIGYYAFSGCTGLSSVTIPNLVISIGNNAFSGCTGLTSVTIPSSVITIGGSAFYGCTGLTSIMIPSSVTSIGPSAFYGCTGLTSFTIPSSVTSIGFNVFNLCAGLRAIYSKSINPVSLRSNPFYNVITSNCTLYVPKGSLAAYRNATYWKDFSNIVEDISSASPSVNEMAIKPIFHPSSGDLQIYGLSGMAKVEIFNMSGAKLFTSVVSEGATIHPANLPRGVYLLHVTIGNEIAVIKLSM